ncbi:MAG: sugar isomerase, partial [Ruminococcus sp.]|nr:sugar isomerase [Ruminococcus sp.]
MTKSREKKLVYNTFVPFVLQITTVLCGLILPRLIIKTYGSKVNGLVGSVSDFLGIITLLDLGVGSVVQ